MDFKRFLRAEWDRVAGYAFVFAGAVALVFGFIGVRTAADVIDEISYLVTGGIGAIFLLGVGATLLLSADLHDDFRKLHRVEEKLDDIHRALAERHPDLVVDVRPAAPNDPAPSDPDGPHAAAVAGRPAGQAPEPAVVRAAGLLAVRRYRHLALSGGVVVTVLFVAGALVTANQASTDHMAGSVGLALSGGMLIAVVAGVMVGQLKGRLERQTLAAVGPWLAADDDTGTTMTAAAAEVWVVDGLALYHRAGCRALDGRAASGWDRATLTSGLRPCGLCEPDSGG
jgi:hypothetical protein